MDIFFSLVIISPKGIIIIIIIDDDDDDERFVNFLILLFTSNNGDDDDILFTGDVVIFVSMLMLTLSIFFTVTNIHTQNQELKKKIEKKHLSFICVCLLCDRKTL